MNLIYPRSPDPVTDGTAILGMHIPEGGFQELTACGILGVFHFFRLIVRALLISACVGALAGLVYLIVVPPKYTATAIISPVPKSVSLSMMDSSALGGLAALGASSQMVTPFQLFLNAYDSREVSDAIFKQHPDYLPGLFWHKWDRDDKRWRSPNFLLSFFGSITHRPVMEKPDPEALQQLIKDYVSSQRLGSTDIWELAYKNPDPKLAAAFLSSVLDQTDRKVRTISDARLAQSESYLESKIRTATEVEYRESLYSQLVQVQTARNATHSARTYAFQLVDGPSVDIRRPSPAPLIVLLGFIVGTVLTASLAILILYWKPKNRLPKHG